MNGFLDTNVVVRYLTGEPPDLARRAGEIVDSDVPLLVTDVVLVETAYVLTSFYRVPREVVVDHLIAFVQRQNVAVAWLDKGIVIQGLLLCRPSGRVSFADALVWAAARSAHAGIVYSFDERFPADGIEVRRER